MDTSGLDDFLDDRDFAGVVLVRRGAATIYETAMELASRRWGIQNSLEMRFDTAGITKLFTSVAVLQQVGRGTLDLEASIHDYVDLGGTAIPREVTLLHLLTHSSGIADDADEESDESYDDLWRTTPVYTVIEPRDQLALFAHKQPLAAPGTETSYCNAGYVLAGLALERVTGVPFRQVVFDDVFTRAGMLDSGFYDRREASPRIAEGWDRRDDGVWVQNIFSSPPIGGPDAGAYATADDLIRFLGALRDGALLDAELTEEFFTPQVEHEPGVSFGLGPEFDVEDDGAVRSYYKDGVGPGASGILRHYYESGLDVVVLSNSEDGAWDVVREIDERLGG